MLNNPVIPEAVMFVGSRIPVSRLVCPVETVMVIVIV